MKDDHVLVVAGDGWHSGVIGIAASRLIEKYYKTSLVISVKRRCGQRVMVGSITGFNMYEALNSCKILLFSSEGMPWQPAFPLLRRILTLARTDERICVTAFDGERLHSPY